MEKSKLIIDDDSNMPVQESKNYNSITEEYALMKTEELLDLIDFEYKFGTKIKFSIDDIQNQIEQEALWEHKLNDFMIENEDVFEGCVFNWMGEEEFVDYLKKRYDKQIEYAEWEEIHREIKFKE